MAQHGWPGWANNTTNIYNWKKYIVIVTDDSSNVKCVPEIYDCKDYDYDTGNC
jgi:hypothetical protein